MRIIRTIAKLIGVLGIVQAQAALADANGPRPRPPEKVAFYFAAHQDDWQLFMNPAAFKDVTAANTKTVFVHTTAGDAGLGVGSGGRKHPFYLARDNGAESAIRFMADGENEPAASVSGFRSFNGHEIYRVIYRNTVTYFLHLPDGSPSGQGYPDTGFELLQRLAEGKIPDIAAVDGSTIYYGWNDLVATVHAIVDFERGSAPRVQLNVAERDPRINPHDHSDHLMTAKAALDAVKKLGCANRAYYVDYASADLPENLHGHLRDLTSSVFAVTSAGVRALDHSSNWSWYDQAYVGRSYFRIEAGAGRCAQASPMVAASRPVADQLSASQRR